MPQQQQSRRDELGTFIRVWWKGQEIPDDFDLKHRESLEIDFGIFVDQGKDSVIQLESLLGNAITSAASQISQIRVVTPESREEWFRRAVIFEREEALHKMITGYDTKDDDDE